MDGPVEDWAAAVRPAWERNAPWWDERIGDGNAFQCELIEPATLRLAPVLVCRLRISRPERGEVSGGMIP